MKELREIVNAYDTAKNAGKECVLATIVHLEGSSYRRPGARMLVLEDGAMIGAISGGCLEGDALVKALLTFSEKKSRVITYDTSDEDDATIGVQLGCEGVIQVLFEYINKEDSNNPVELLRKSISTRQEAALVTYYDLSDKRAGQEGACLLQLEDGTRFGRNPFIQFDASLQNDIAEVFLSKTSRFIEHSNDEYITHTFIEYLEVPLSLVIVGAGNDAIPVMQLAEILGWEVRIVDGRKTHAKQDRFISACQVLVSKPEAVLQQIDIDSRTCFVLMTHNFLYDLQMLKALIQTSIPYIGVLGPKKKLTKLLQQIKEEGNEVSDEMLSRIYGPIGLDIGAETPEEIAASIISEIQAVFTNRKGGMLKWKKETIHSNRPLAD